MLVKRYLYNASTDEKYAINGCLKTDFEFGATPMSEITKYTPDQLERAVDLRPFMSEVEYQYAPTYGTMMAVTNSCTAHSCIGAYEYLLRRFHQNKADMSRLFLYYNARAINPVYARGMTDAGCSIPHAIYCLEKYGVCTENRWQFNYGNLNRPPSADCYSEAKQFLTTDSIKVEVNEHSMKSCLAQGFPIIFSLKLYHSFEQGTYNKGWIPQPQMNEPTRSGRDELHAMLAVGYNDEHRVFVVRNSWGKQWGDEGYCKIPYNYLAQPYYCNEAYAIRKMGVTDLGTQHWFSDPSQMPMGFQMNFGGSEGGSDEDWSVEEESVEPTGDTPTVHPDELAAAAGNEPEEPAAAASDEEA